jgi:molybdenum cofactor cytidylyltransferase
MIATRSSLLTTARSPQAIRRSRWFLDLAALQGGAGARHLLRSVPEAGVEVSLSGTAALVDVDTPDALEAVKAEIEGA